MEAFALGNNYSEADVLIQAPRQLFTGTIIAPATRPSDQKEKVTD